MKTFKEFAKNIAPRGHKIVKVFDVKGVETMVTMNNKGKFNLMFNNQVVDTFDSQKEAMRAAKQFGSMMGKRQIQMKLITEHTEEVSYIVEDKEGGGKNYIIEGIFAQAEQKNRNGRIYPKAILESAVSKYDTEQVKTQRAVGELNHPAGPIINLDKVSHRITELKWNGNDVMGKALILDTPNGQIVKGLLDGGVKLGVSTRGMGTLEQKGGVNMVGKDFVLNTVDIVQDPSAPSAFVNGIMEGVEWIWNNGVLEAQELERIETEIKNASRSDRSAVEIREFKNFLSKINL